MQHNPAFEKLCEIARKNIKEIDIIQVNHLMQANQLPLFIDVREDNEWQNDHLPNAKHMGRGIIERDIETVVPDKDLTIILYCGGGYRSIARSHSNN